MDRLQELYETYVNILPEAYAFREPETSMAYEWVSPVYASRDRRPRIPGTPNGRPVFENLRQPNFLPRLLAALPTGVQILGRECPRMQ
jgi:hypothetical protein